MFVGHQKIIHRLNRMLDNGNIAQAYLFSGPRSVGKFTLAKIFCEAVISGRRKINFNPDEKGNDPVDLIVVAPEVEEKRGVKKEKSIKIERIRDVSRDLSLFPYQGKFKTLVIDNAHRMTEESQNALLKILEEPNHTTIIVLVTHEESKILPTIKSRCQKINFALVSEKEIGKMLGVKSSTGNFIHLGRPGVAAQIIENEESAEFFRSASLEFEKIRNLGTNEKLKLAENWSKNIPQAVNRLEVWLWMIHQDSIEENQMFSLKLKNYEWLDKIEKCLDILKNTGVNSRLVIENLFLEF